MKRYPNFDWLRIYLALTVVCAHAYAHLNIKHGGWGLDPVPAFVALSGFLIPGSFAASKNWQHFAWKRVLRVYPAFLTAIILGAVLFGGSSILPTLAGYASIGLLWVSGNVNGALWSLMLEELLYTSHVVSRLRDWWSCRAATICFAVTFALSVALFAHNETDRIFRAASAYFLGNVAYFNKDRLRNPVLLIGAFVPLFVATHYMPDLRAITTPFMGVLAVLICATVKQLPKPLDISYGAYVYHLPILLTVSRMHLQNAFWWTLAITIVFASISAIAIEQPILKLKNRPWQLPKKSPEPTVVEVPA